MLKSMTAYSRNTLSTSFGTLTIEIRSVNKRFLEIDFNMPNCFLEFEDLLRKKIADKISRGKVKVYISSHFEKLVKISPNIPLVRQLRSAYEEISKELGEKKPKLDLGLFLQDSNILKYEEQFEKKYFKELEKGLEETLSKLIVMKEKEGKALQKDMLSRLSNLRTLLGKIEKKAPKMSNHYRKRLEKLLEEFDTADNEERILREVAIFADRTDVVEEIVRFYSHLDQFEKLLHEKSQGKTLGFLIQEMMRESNTIGSKAISAEISHTVVAMKSELERIREQVQNVE